MTKFKVNSEIVEANVDHISAWQNGDFIGNNVVDYDEDEHIYTISKKDFDWLMELGEAEKYIRENALSQEADQYIESYDDAISYAKNHKENNQ